MKKFVVFVMAAAILISGMAYAENRATLIPAGKNKTAVIDVGNKMCPVMGGKVNGKDFYEYNGKRYGLCCPMCIASFKADPKKYSAIADKEIASKK